MKNLVSIFFLVGSSVCSQAQNTVFEFLDKKVKPGQALSFDYTIKAKNGDTTFMPMTIIHGKNPGPVIGLIAGIHGYEYPPIMAMQKFPGLIDPVKLKGTIVIVQLANVNAFYKRSVFYNPADSKNVNRTFPGNKDGTISECISYTIAKFIIPRCDYFVDIHAGDASEDLHPYVSYYSFGDQTVKAKQMAYALNFPWVIVSENNPQRGKATTYCTAEAVSQNVPTVAIEYGKLGHVTDTDADFINGKLVNLLTVLEFLDGKPETAIQPFVITKRSSIASKVTGMFYTSFRSGEIISKGAVLGVIKDLHGNKLDEIISPINGVIIYLSVTPPISKGETLFSLAEF